MQDASHETKYVLLLPARRRAGSHDGAGRLVGAAAAVAGQAQGLRKEVAVGAQPGVVRPVHERPLLHLGRLEPVAPHHCLCAPQRIRPVSLRRGKGAFKRLVIGTCCLQLERPLRAVSAPAERKPQRQGCAE